MFRLFTCIVVAACLIAYLSCSKKKDDNIASNFSWTFEGVNYTANIDTAFSSWIYAAPYASPAPVIIATRREKMIYPGKDFIIYLSSLNTGSYSFASFGNNLCDFIDPLGFPRLIVSGNLNITTNSGNRLAGNFSFILDNSTPLNGTFTNVPVR